MINIKGTNLWPVKVPVDAYRFTIIDDMIVYFTDMPDTPKYLPEGEWQILGEATKDNISFDVEPYVQTTEWHFPERHIVYRNYLEPLSSPNPFMNDWKQEWGVSFSNPNESFYSLLSASGQYWVNPMGEEPKLKDYDVEFDFNIRHLLWHDYQDNILSAETKLLILNKI